MCMNLIIKIIILKKSGVQLIVIECNDATNTSSEPLKAFKIELKMFKANIKRMPT